MTREQQKEYNAENYPASALGWLNKATDRAFDEFESRVCENCRFCTEDNNDTDVWIHCTNKDSQMEYTSLIVDGGYPEIIDFGCNKWEQK